MISKNIIKFGKPEISRWILAVGMLIPFLKYNLKFPEYIDIFYILYMAYLIAAQADSKEAIFGGIILLVTLPFLLILKRESFAEITANGAYYLLFAGTLAQLIKFFFGKKSR